MKRILCWLYGHLWTPLYPLRDTPHQKCSRCGAIKYGQWDYGVNWGGDNE